jgi:hypothetical protein
MSQGVPDADGDPADIVEIGMGLDTLDVLLACSSTVARVP